MLVTAVVVVQRRRGTHVLPADLAVAVLESGSLTIAAGLDELGLDRSALVRAVAQA